MSILTATNLTKLFGADEIFSGITVDIPDKARIALVGPNGAGKTTLINILIGLDTPTDGAIHTKRGLEMGFLPQRPTLSGQRTLWEEMMTAFVDIHQKEARLKELEEAIADPNRVDERDELLERYGHLQHRFEFEGGYDYEHETRRVLHGLGFEPDDYNMPLNHLSGGQVTRALLARLLLEKPDLLVLDEPTNHLDIRAVEWLESYLNGWEGAVLLVSHDRYFMDETVNVVWEMNFGEIETYRGNYSHYVQQRQERHERRLKEYEAQQAFIKKELDYIDRNIAGQNTSQAQGRRKRLERMMSGTDRHGRAIDDPWMIRRPVDNNNFSMRLTATRTGTNVFRTKGLAIGYADADEPLFYTPEILLLRGEVAAIIGPNGVGKSTFLKAIFGQLPPLSGEYEWGSKVKVGYFAQAHEGLNPDNTLLDEIIAIENMGLSKTRNYLAGYLFQGDDVFRKVATLSGGERGRLALAKLALMGANVLLLDEPSNHLDIPSQEILQEVLNTYTGTILLVSHDRYLIEALASQIWAVDPGEMTVFKGSYKEFLGMKAGTFTPDTATIDHSRPMDDDSEASSVVEQKSAKPSHGLNAYQLKKRLDELEKTIHKLEAEIAQITSELNTASEKGDLDNVTKLGQRYAEVEEKLSVLMDEWAELA